MIKIEQEENLYCPKILCDCCAKEIKTTSKALVLWDEVGNVFHIHQGICDKNFDKGRWFPWESLETHLNQLCFNVGLKEMVRQ